MTSNASGKNQSDLDWAISELQQGSRRLRRMSILQRRAIVDACVVEVARSAKAWVAAACSAKRIPVDQPLAAEEILAGPATLIRYLQLLSGVFGDFDRLGKPRLPGRPYRNSAGRVCVPILPVKSLFDNIIFAGLKADVWLESGADESSLFSDPLAGGDLEPAPVAAVLGAGNVSAIPATDMLYKIFHDNETVLLKLNPVNDYLEAIFNDAFRPLVDAKLLRMVRGDSRVGNSVIHHPGISSVHITGSHHTHDAIVWGTDPRKRQTLKAESAPFLTKPITSELGNVTPWVIVPGDYSSKQLRSQAEHVVASIVNNASFNCLATKMIVTSKGWPQRNEFLDIVDSLLASVPNRFAYYPGAKNRFEQATGKPAPVSGDDTLPWMLLRGADPIDMPHLFEEESFVCVCAETSIDEPTDKRFLESAVDFLNERLFGTLCATITVTDQFRRDCRSELDTAISSLRYGTVCINQWSGVAYGLMTPPWGGHSSTTLETPQSGMGHVHNTFFLQNFEKTVVWGPLYNFPKPVWFPSHRNGNQLGWALLRLYAKPSVGRLPALLFHALRG